MDEPTDSPRFWPRLIPFAALLIGGLCSVLLWLSLKQAFHNQVEAALPSIHAQQLQTLQQAVDGRLVALRQLANTLPYTPRDRTALQRLGSRLLQSYPDVTALVWASRSNGQLRALQQLGQTPKAIDQTQDLDRIPFWHKALEQAWETGEAQATPVSRVPNGEGTESVVYLLHPLPQRSVLIMALSPEALVKETLTQGFALPRLYDLSSQSQQPLFTPLSKDQLPQTNDVQWQSSLTFADREWMLQSLPVITLPDRIRKILQGVLVVGFGLSLVMFLVLFRVVHRWQQALQRIDDMHREWERDRSALQNKAIEKDVLSHALDDSERRTRDYIALQDGFAYELDDEWRIGFLSPQIHDLIARPPAELAHCPLTELVAEDERGRVEEALKACRKDREMVRIDTRLLTRSGDTVAVTLRIKAVMDALNECMGYRGTGWRRPDHDGA